MSVTTKSESSVAELWAEIPSIDCVGACYHYCGLVLATEAENEELRRYTEAKGMEYHPFETDKASSASEHLRLVGNKVECPYLKEKRCTVYEVRPSICRMWGNAESMPCFMGCKRNGKRLSDSQCESIFKRMENLS